MAYPILVDVRDRNGAYSCRFPNGCRASSTHSADVAVERLMDKTWPPGTHRAERTGRKSALGLTEFAIWPIEQQEG